MLNADHKVLDHKVLSRNVLDHYPGLLVQAGKSTDDLRATLLPSQPEPTGTALSLASILANPEAFSRQLAVAATHRQTEPRVLASVIHQSLALEVLGPLTMRLFLDGTTQLPDPRNLWLDTSGDNGRWHNQGTGTAVSVTTYVELVASLVNAWYPVFRQQLGVSAGAYWSSTGLGLCAPYSALYDSAPPDRLCEHAGAWLARFNCDARRFIDWIPYRFGSSDCAIPQRRGCCQKYRLPEGGYCGTCGIYRKQRISVT